MLLPSVLSFALVVLWSAVALCDCNTPQVRREWRSFSTDEQAAWLNAIKCLANQPHDSALSPSVDPSESSIPPVNPSSSYYDDVVYMHMDLNVEIHYTGLFLPWHRWYLYAFEGALRDKCGYGGVTPYWDWTIDAPDFFESSFWQDSDPNSGLGGWGDPNNDYRVPNGALSNMTLTYPSTHTVRRSFTLQPFQVPNQSLYTNPNMQANSSFSASAIQAILGTSAGDYNDFQMGIETFEGPHGSVHLIMGGDMAGTCPQNAPSSCTQGPTWSPNDPLFWMHHAMLDRIWYEWQLSNPQNGNSFSGGSVQCLDSLQQYQQFPTGCTPDLYLNSTLPTDGLFPQLTIGDVMNTTGGVLCYVYQ